MLPGRLRYVQAAKSLGTFDFLFHDTTFLIFGCSIVPLLRNIKLLQQQKYAGCHPGEGGYRWMIRVSVTW